MPLQVTLPKRVSVLSDASLSLDPSDPLRGRGIGKVYRRNGVTVERLSAPRTDRSQRYPEMLVPPALGWFPSTSSNFIFGDENIKAEKIFKLVPQIYNPSVWTSSFHDGVLVLRVPKDRKQQTWDRLYSEGYWYHGAKNMWFKRKRVTLD